LQNVKDSDGTVIIYFEKLGGGTDYSMRYCIEQQRPYKLIDAGKVSAKDAVKLISDFVREYKIDVLNIVGPRETEWPKGYDYAFHALEIFLAL